MRATLDITEDDGLHGVLAAMRDYNRANLSLAFKHAMTMVFPLKRLPSFLIRPVMMRLAVASRVLLRRAKSWQRPGQLNTVSVG